MFLFSYHITFSLIHLYIKKKIHRRSYGTRDSRLIVISHVRGCSHRVVRRILSSKGTIRSPSPEGFFQHSIFGTSDDLRRCDPEIGIEFSVCTVGRSDLARKNAQSPSMIRKFVLTVTSDNFPSYIHRTRRLLLFSSPKIQVQTKRYPINSNLCSASHTPSQLITQTP